MKIKYFLLLLIVFSQALNSQWISNYYGRTPSQIALTNAHGTAVTVDNYGYCYVTGYVDEMLGSGNDILIIKYEAASGDTAWVRTFNGTANDNDQGYGIVVDNYQNIYVAGTAKSLDKGYDGILLKYDASGNFLWSKIQNGDAVLGEDISLDIAIDNYGYIYVTGFVTNTDSYTDIYTAKYSPWGGFRLWHKRYDGTENLNARGLKVAVSNDGSDVYVAGYTDYSNGSSNICLINYSAFDGNRKFVSDSYNGSGNSTDKAFGIAVDEYDNIFITGYVTVDSITGSTDCVTLMYNSTGSLVWDKTFGGAANESDKAFGIVVDEDRVFVTGSARMTSGNDDYITICYNYSGNVIWTKNYDGTGHGIDEASALAVVYTSSNEKSLIVTGKSWGTDNNCDYATITYSYITGDEIEVSRFFLSTVSEDVPKDIAVDLMNNAYITGFSELMGGNGPNGSSCVSTVMNKFSPRNKKVTSIQIPKEFNLMQNFPNPFNPSTKIRFTIPDYSFVTLKVFDVTGRVVSTLISNNLGSGSYEVTFTSPSLASGSYFYELVAGKYRDVKKMSIIK